MKRGSLLDRIAMGEDPFRLLYWLWLVVPVGVVLCLIVLYLLTD